MSVKSLMSLTAHWLTDGFKMEHAVLRPTYARQLLLRDKSCLVYVEKSHGRESRVTSRAE